MAAKDFDGAEADLLCHVCPSNRGVIVQFGPESQCLVTSTVLHFNFILHKILKIFDFFVTLCGVLVRPNPFIFSRRIQI